MLYEKGGRVVIVFNMLLFVAIIGGTIGALLTSSQLNIRLQLVVLISIFFFVCCYIGMLIGFFLLGWLHIAVIQYSTVIITLLLIIASVTRFQPTTGFFQQGDYIFFTLFLLLFLCIGIEWGMLGYKTLLMFVSFIVFVGALIIGAMIQMLLRQFFWRYIQIAFTPLVILLVVILYRLF